MRGRRIAYGNVRGLFDNRRTAIEATVALGRTNFYALERVGRIGALWNRAKHVIIYRREVVPPGQFYNEEPIGKQQDEHAGRAILRKWEEYIEILQPERRYPDLAGEADRTGFLRASRFHAKRIRIDSRWGADVPGGGWAVPLWQSSFRSQTAATEDSPAALYPKPHIALLCAGRDGQEHEQEVRHPEKIYFFASSREGETDDTDAWAVVEGIDWADEVWPSVPATGGPGSYPADVRLSKPPTAPPEQGRFAIEVIRGEPIAVAHGLKPANDPTYAASMNLRPDRLWDEVGRLHDPTYMTIQFFELMVAAAAHQGVRWHMWLFYMEHLSKAIIAIHDEGGPEIDPASEHPTRGSELLYRILSALRDWIELHRYVPEGNVHRNFEHASLSEHEGRIPKSAVTVLSRVLEQILLAPNIGDGFKAYAMEIATRSVHEMGTAGVGATFRNLLISGLTGSASIGDPGPFRREAYRFYRDIDHVLRMETPDLGAALRKVQPRAPVPSSVQGSLPVVRAKDSRWRRWLGLLGRRPRR